MPLPWGEKKLGIEAGKASLAQKQAAAAVGQTILTQAYESVLAPLDIVTAQALLTLNDTEDRRRWINAQETLSTLLDVGVVPIVNENDTVATDEIRYGDNDRLGARVAQMVSADCLILLSDIDGLYDIDPAQNPKAKHVPVVNKLTPDIFAMGGDANLARGTGTGGMVTKLQAAKIATEAGCSMIITQGQIRNPLRSLAAGKVKSTLFRAQTNPKSARKSWIAGSLKPAGSVIVDTGAQNALHNGKSLLAAGVIDVDGQFIKGDAVQILNENKVLLGHGLISYTAREAALIKGLNSSDIEKTLGYNGGAALIHRDNMVLAT